MTVQERLGATAFVDPSSEPVRPIGLADAMRAHTQRLHLQAERSGILRDLLKGKADRTAYARLLRGLLPVYEALERGLDRHKASREIRPFANPDVYRSASLRSDLTALAGPAWTASLPVAPSALRYADRITVIAQGEATLLIAHAYVRYLGDLNGGQILKRVLGTSLKLGPEALSFYDFPAIGDLASFIPLYRAAFDAAGVEIMGNQPLLEEADAAFRFNIDLSEDVRDAAGSHG